MNTSRPKRNGKKAVFILLTVMMLSAFSMKTFCAIFPGGDSVPLSDTSWINGIVETARMSSGNKAAEVTKEFINGKYPLGNLGQFWSSNVEGVNLLSSQCCGYANFFFYKMFGHTTYSDSYKVCHETLSTSARLKQILEASKCGAHIRVFNNSGVQHSMVFLFLDGVGPGFYLLHWNNGVSSCEYVPFDGFIQHFRGCTIYVDMPNNYPAPARDNTPPSISNIRMTENTKKGYKITCTVTDNVGVDKVLFPTWREKDTSAGCTWYPGTKNGNEWSFVYTGAVSQDKYVTHIYAYDAAGNSSSATAPSVMVDQTLPIISDVTYKQDNKGYTVTCRVSDNISGVGRVQFPTWTAKNDQDDIDKAWETSTKSRGTRQSGDANNGQYSFRVNYSDHNNEEGTYYTHIYAYDNHSNRAGAVIVTVNATIDRQGPDISGFQIADKTPTGCKVSCVIADNAGVEKVEIWKFSEEYRYRSPINDVSQDGNRWTAVSNKFMKSKKENKLHYKIIIFAWDKYENESTFTSDLFTLPDPEDPVTVTWEDKTGGITASNAILQNRVTANRSCTFTKTCVRIWDDTGKEITGSEQNINSTGTYLDLSANVKEELKQTLSPGKTYSYQFAVTTEGKEYTSSVWKLTTLEEKPEPSVTWSNEGSGKKSGTDVTFALSAAANISGTYTKSGIYITNSSTGKQTLADQMSHTTTGYKFSQAFHSDTMDYNFKPNGSYKYRFFVVFDEKTYNSPEYSFTMLEEEKKPDPTQTEEPEPKLPVTLRSWEILLNGQEDYSVAYTGKAKKPTVTVFDENDKKVSPKAYKVTYRNNKKIGLALVQVTGKGTYQGLSASRTFEITPPKMKIKTAKSPKKGQIQLKWAKSKYIAGFEIECSLSKKFPAGEKTQQTVLENPAAVRITLKGLRSKKKWYVRMRSIASPYGVNIYGPWSAVKAVKVR